MKYQPLIQEDLNVGTERVWITAPAGGELRSPRWDCIPSLEARSPIRPRGRPEPSQTGNTPRLPLACLTRPWATS